MRVQAQAKQRAHRVMEQARLLRLQESLDAFAGRMNALATYLHRTAEEEKQRLARALHDDLGGVLTLAKIDVHLLRDSNACDSKATQGRLDRLSRALDEAVSIERRAVETLQPSLLDHLGLAAALEHHVSDICARAQIECRCGPMRDADRLAHDQAIVIYRLVQEGLANIVEARRASCMELSLCWRKAMFRLRLTEHVARRDVEWSPLHRQRLESMRQRARALGGKLELRRLHDDEVRIDVSFPWRPDRRACALG